MMSRATTVLILALCHLVAPPARAQTATVEMVSGTVVTSGTMENRTAGAVREHDRLVPGTRIHLGKSAVVVLIQSRSVSLGRHDPQGTSRSCVTWTILGGVEGYTVRKSAEMGSGECRATPANVGLPDPATPMPFTRRVRFEVAANDRADFAEPEMLMRLRQMCDRLRAPVAGKDPAGDIAVSHTLEGTAPPQLAITGKATNKSAKFYFCVELRFSLLERRPGDTYVQLGTSSVTLRRLGARETRTFKRNLDGSYAVTLASVAACQ